MNRARAVAIFVQEGLGLRDKIQRVWAAVYRSSWSYSLRRQSPTISIYKSNSNSALFGSFLEGDGFGLVTILETESQARLARVKAKTLVRAGQLGRVS
jgi:hypothetical protein